MAQKLKILIRLDADHHVGLAHAVRVSGILSLGKWKLNVHLIGNVPQSEKFFGSAAQIHPLAAGTEQEKALSVIKTAERIKADILMVDHPHLSEISWTIFVKSGLRLIAIDDVGGAVMAGLILNGTILDSYHHYPHMENVHCGGKYALINPCFAQQVWTDRGGLVCVIGSGDRACDWALKLTAAEGPLTVLEGGRKTMIVGASFPQAQLLSEQCVQNNIELHQGLDQLSLANIMSAHSVGLITGGMIVYEALAAGLPVIVFPQEKNLPPEAQFFGEHGAIVDLGYEGGMDMALVGDEIKKMMISREKRLTLSDTARKLIDGKGMQRAVEIMDVYFKEGAT